MELQAVGHTTFAQYSTCARDIVRNYLLNSEVGVSHHHGKSGADVKGGVCAVTSRVYQVRGGF